MANIVWHRKLRIYLDLTRADLGHEEYEDLLGTVYTMDRMYSARDVPVRERDLQCGGVCQEAGVEAPMFLRVRNGRREAVHERAEDEERHTAPVSDEHKAYQEGILKTAQEGGYRGDSEVRTRVGRSWIQTDTLIEGADGRRIGWEIQLSSAGTDGPRSVRARASKAEKNGITPAWHIDRADYAQRHDSHWTRSDSLPAYVIAKTGDLRVVSGFRALDFWRCDTRAVHPCPHGVRRCGKVHATPTPRSILFDDLVRSTAAGLVVPIQFRTVTKQQRFWVTDADRDRLEELYADDTQLPPAPDATGSADRASYNRPTCKTTRDTVPYSVPTPAPASAAAALPHIPAQPAPSASESATPPVSPVGTVVHGDDPREDAVSFEALISAQQAADCARQRLEQLSSDEERRHQRTVWFDVASQAQAAVTRYAQAKRLNRFEVEQRVRQAAREEAGPQQPGCPNPRPRR
ncbi:hypothetical protein ACGFZB_41240 [Streptomyces cinerochromogenes]|uniref:Uncharacterized protein n=1 Tax=Streptomyces cinerochromogenes TaxID=66422 RepID=A0ABW7BHX1_9ACTN